jgi:hypothetical protein
MLARIVEAGDLPVREVLHNGEGGNRGRQPGLGVGPQVFGKVPQQGVAHPLPVQDPPGDDRPAHRAVGQHAQQQAHLDHLAGGVDPNRHGVDVHHRHRVTGRTQPLRAEPTRLGQGVAVGRRVDHLHLAERTFAARSLVAHSSGESSNT